MSDSFDTDCQIITFTKSVDLFFEYGSQYGLIDILYDSYIDTFDKNYNENNIRNEFRKDFQAVIGDDIDNTKVILSENNITESLLMFSNLLMTHNLDKV